MSSSLDISDNTAFDLRQCAREQRFAKNTIREFDALKLISLWFCKLIGKISLPFIQDVDSKDTCSTNGRLCSCILID